jgi:hypothetical protein
MLRSRRKTMSNFNIGDKVVDINSGVEGRVTDRLYSEARSRFVYVIKPSDGGRSFTREDGEIEFAQNNVEYRVDTQSIRRSPIMLSSVSSTRSATASKLRCVAVTVISFMRVLKASLRLVLMHIRKHSMPLIVASTLSRKERRTSNEGNTMR